MLEKIELLKEEWKEEIIKLREMTCPLILFGAGSTSQFIVEQLAEYRIFPVAFCDNDNNKVGLIVAGLEVIGIGQLVEKYQGAYIYITTQLYYTIIRKQLISLGINKNQISEYDIIFQMEWEKEYIEYCKSKSLELEWLYHRLSDNRSKKVLYNRLAFFRTRKRDYMVEVRDENQYFDGKLIALNEINTFIDCGMYVGDTIEQFLRLNDKGCEIWGFEPDYKIADIARSTLSGIHNCKIHIVEKATSNECGIIKVKKSLGNMQTIAANTWGNSAERINEFEVCTLDEYFKDNNVKLDFIKMDVEGAEYASLQGGEKVIRKNHPILAICVYHKKEDLFTIPRFILGLSENYKLYLRHYSDNQTETVCYALLKEKT